MGRGGHHAASVRDRFRESGVGESRPLVQAGGREQARAGVSEDDVGSGVGSGVLGDSYYVRLVGPAIVVGQVEDVGDGSYRVWYFVAEAGRSPLHPKP